MLFHAVDAEIEKPCDFFVFKALGDEPENLDLPGGECGYLWFCATVVRLRNSRMVMLVSALKIRANVVAER